MSYTHVKAFRNRVKTAMVTAMGGQCRTCGYNRCDRALTAHHLDPSKKDFSLVGWASMNTVNIINEMKKCILLCMNCHMEFHAGIRNLDGITPIFNDKIAEELTGCTARLRCLERRSRGIGPKVKRMSKFSDEDLCGLLKKTWNKTKSS